MNIQRTTARRPRRASSASALLTSSIAVLAAAAAVATVAAAPDAKAPRIVSAAMQDVDGDARADGVRLTYSERVRHAADRDGKYPIRVAGYRIRSVGKASGRTIQRILVVRTAARASQSAALHYGLWPPAPDSVNAACACGDDSVW